MKSKHTLLIVGRREDVEELVIEESGMCRLVNRQQHMMSLTGEGMHQSRLLRLRLGVEMLGSSQEWDQQFVLEPHVTCTCGRTDAV